MKTHLHITLAAALALVLCTACQSRKTSATHFQEYEQPDTTHTLQRMKDYHFSAQVRHLSTPYAYDVVRCALDSAVPIRFEGEEYADNYIVLRVNRQEQEIFRHRFTKADFAAYLPKDFLHNAILEGMAFDHDTPEGLKFAVSISYPSSDIFIPLSITIAPNGSYTIRKDDVIDNVVETEEEAGSTDI